MDEQTTLEAGRPLVAAADATAVGMAFQMRASADGAARSFSFIGQRCLALNGITAEAAMADPNLLYDMILPEHRPAFLAAEAEALAALKAFDIEVAMRRADGEVRWHRIASMPQAMPDGSTVWEGLQIDVTERRRIAAELAEQRRRLELAVEATGLGFWEWDLRTRTLIWSERNKALFGLPANDAIDIDRYTALIHPDDLVRAQGVFVEVRDRPGGGDFSVEHRVVTPSGEVRWLSVHGRVEHDENGPAVAVGTSLDITERRDVDERRNLLMGELAHRSKNGIAVVLAIVNQTARSATSVEQFEDALSQRLQAMALSQDLVTESGGRPVRLSRVAETVLSPFGLAPFDLDPALEQVSVSGDMASGIALILHEMATNAVKYGALSNGRGRIAIEGVADAGAGLAALHWRESGGPPVKPDGRRGFGSKLLDSALRNRGGKVEPVFHVKGFHARVEFPREG